ncbi:GRF-type domain-containing protein [Heracleum sosnowskyi]|uniref:GRF-type domain-containing protein n=1 Tax=Heracleum sosnowskyi TaxID=360622 RepID=A0AAD8IZI0_9APIA|nr:GRF-type domain-containing protein [Heracleum sosnowskyi]
MTNYQSPLLNSAGSSSSLQSVKKEEHRLCLCGRRARVYTSWTLKNPGRRFYTCATPKEGEGCQFFQWFEEDFSPRALEMITHLNHRRIYLEEKLKLAEENLSKNVEKKKALKEEKKQLIQEKLKMETEKNKMGRQMKIYVVCLAVLMFALMINLK